MYNDLKLTKLCLEQKAVKNLFDCYFLSQNFNKQFDVNWYTIHTRNGLVT